MRKSDAAKKQTGPAEVAKTCIAKREGACARSGDCLECGPVEQTLRTASWALARWPRLGRPPRRG